MTLVLLIAFALVVIGFAIAYKEDTKLTNRLAILDIFLFILILIFSQQLKF